MTGLDLAAIRERADNATPGPWEAYSSEATMNDRSEWRIGDRSRPQVLRSVMAAADADFVAAARTDIPNLLDALQAVRDLHIPATAFGEMTETNPDPKYCHGCDQTWPCATIQAIEGDPDGSQ